MGQVIKEIWRVRFIKDAPPYKKGDCLNCTKKKADKLLASGVGQYADKPVLKEKKKEKKIEVAVIKPEAERAVTGEARVKPRKSKAPKVSSSKE